MRLFIVDKTTVAELLKSQHSPKAGDHIAYFRSVQVLDDSIRGECETRGITISWIEENIDFKERQAIDRFVQDFADSWLAISDVSSLEIEGLELASHLTPDFVHDYVAGHMVVFGEICQREVSRYPEVECIFTDVSDGNGVFECKPLALPKAGILRDIVKRRGIEISFFKPVDPLPAHSLWNIDRNFSQYLYAFIGGLRWKYLKYSFHQYLKKKQLRIYFFAHKGVSDLIKTIKEKSSVQIFSNVFLNEVTTIRIDHVFALPTFNSIKLYFKTRHCCHKLSSAKEHPLATYGGINYLPYFTKIIDDLYGPRLIATLLRFLQIKKLLKTLNLKFIFINGFGGDMRALLHFAKKQDLTVVFLGHGLNSLKIPVREYTRNREDMIWFCQGRYHPYGADIPEKSREHFPAIGSTLVDSVRSSVGKRGEKSLRRVLLAGYSDAPGQTVTRAYLADTYMHDIFRVAGTLAKEGFQFTYRIHPGPSFSRKYIIELIDRMDLADIIKIDNAPSFADALSCHDLLITNLSSTIYEAISVGWPVIIHEPHYQIDALMGILGSNDFEKPISTTPEALIELIRSHSDPSSLVNRFPSFILENHRARFFGENIEKINERISEYIIENLLNGADY